MYKLRVARKYINIGYLIYRQKYKKKKKEMGKMESLYTTYHII